VPTPSMEDYLERIYKLIDEKGYARVSDIAEGLEVHPSSVTKMIQKLDKDQYLIYEKYRGLVLTNNCWNRFCQSSAYRKRIFIRMSKGSSII
jgi:Mn-dependent DtxR family transcriptional regulator